MVWHHRIYSRERVHFLDVQVALKNNEISTDLYVKETYSHQYFHASSCYTYHCIKSIPNSQALRLKRICPSNIFHVNRCNQLEKWLSDRNYKQKLVKNKLLRQELYLRRHCLIMKEIFRLRIGWRLILNLTYRPLLKDFQKVLNEVQILPLPNVEHKIVFGEKPPKTG